VSSYHPEGHFDWIALSKLQALGFKVLTAMDEIRHQEGTKKSQRCGDSIALCPIAMSPAARSGINKSPEDEEFFGWLSSVLVPRTWQSLYHVLGRLHYGEELSEQIGSFLSGEMNQYVILKMSYRCPCR
jgi:hypothetical protein